jgi:hypothetical protein
MKLDFLVGLMRIIYIQARLPIYYPRCFNFFFTVCMLVRLFWRHTVETVGLYWNVIFVAYSAAGMCIHAARMLSHWTVRGVFCDSGRI